jgi:galactose-1-phosphate uridylyltransferase
MLAVRRRTAWTPPVVRTVATTGEGVPALLEAIERHHAFLGERAEQAPPKVEFRVRKKIARIHDPRRAFELTEIESEVREDPLTGETSRICHFAFPPRQVPGLAPLAESTRASCPFCPEKIEPVTPRYPEELVPGGRMRRGEAVLFPNLFPYDDVSAIVAMQREHFAPMHALRPDVIADSLLLARDFIARAAAGMAGKEAFGIVTWNYMPPAGGTQIHPHMQVVVTTTPGNAVARMLVASEAYAARTGRAFARDLLDAERDGPRWIGEGGRVAWLAPFAPIGVLGDAMAIFQGRSTIAELDDEDIARFAATLTRILAGFAARGLWSFNLSLLPDRLGASDARHWLTAHVVPRLWLNPRLHVGDASHFQLLLGERFAMLHPEAVAAALRASFAA